MTTTETPIDAPAVPMPRLNEPAPAFTAPTTDGQLSLSDFAGKGFPTC